MFECTNGYMFTVNLEFIFFEIPLVLILTTFIIIVSRFAVDLEIVKLYPLFEFLHYNLCIFWVLLTEVLVETVLARGLICLIQCS